MNALSQQAQDFLEREGWGAAQQQIIPADFSTRCFIRLTRTDAAPATAILMIAGEGQKTKEFIFVAKLLREVGLSAPEIYAAREDQNLVLMEDFGDTNMGRQMDAGNDPKPFLQAGMDALVRLHEAFQPNLLQGGNLPVFNADLFTQQAQLFLDGYAPRLRPGQAVTAGEREEFAALWQSILKPVSGWPQTVLLRDYMPDNLMYLPQRRGWYRAGILDFQDAGSGPMPYDVASLLERVRRDLPQDLPAAMVSYYCERHPIMDKRDMLHACRLLSAQRHIRILGNVAQRPNKLGFLPRIEAHMNRLFAMEELAPLHAWLVGRGLWA